MQNDGKYRFMWDAESLAQMTVIPASRPASDGGRPPSPAKPQAPKPR